MEKTVRTAVGALIQTAHKHNLPYEYVANSVMNRDLDVFPDRLPPSNQIPFSQYWAIGDGALTATFGADNKVELWPVPHSPRHTGLYSQVPFVLRAYNRDLSVQERSRFRMRKIIELGGVRYVAYYLRTMDFTNTQARLEYRKIENGVVTSTPWAPTPDDQHPKRPPINPGQVYVTGDDYIAATAKSRLVFTPWDITELINVSNILYGINATLTISEIAICSGRNEQATGDFNGAQVQYTESMGVQITDFISTLLPVNFNEAGASINLDTGATEPLLELRSATQGRSAASGSALAGSSFVAPSSI